MNTTPSLQTILWSLFAGVMSAAGAFFPLVAQTRDPWLLLSAAGGAFVLTAGAMLGIGPRIPASG